MSLRVIAGSARGRRLKSAPGDVTRPITDRVKEALFNILGGDVVDSEWWDMFGGTGAVGIEALSRGAAFVRFTDLHRGPIDTIKTNLVTVRLGSRAEVIRADVHALLPSRADRQFHYTYIAPPQYKGEWARTLIELDHNPGWLAEDGWAIVQIDPKEYIQVDLRSIEEFERRRYGSSLLVFYRLKSEGAPA